MPKMLKEAVMEELGPVYTYMYLDAHKRKPQLFDYSRYMQTIDKNKSIGVVKGCIKIFSSHAGNLDHN